MTVGQLIAELQKIDPATPVLIPWRDTTSDVLDIDVFDGVAEIRSVGEYGMPEPIENAPWAPKLPKEPEFD